MWSCPLKMETFLITSSQTQRKYSQALAGLAILLHGCAIKFLGLKRIKRRLTMISKAKLLKFRDYWHLRALLTL